MRAAATTGAAGVTLRAVAERDLPDLEPPARRDDPFGWFGFRATNGMAKQYAEDGLLGRRLGLLIVERDTAPVGYVGWAIVQYGPEETSQALNIGVYVRPEHRGAGVGSAAQAALAEHLFETSLFERLEAATDVENTAEQRALERAGFAFEGVLRHAQYRGGRWHDLRLYSRLRGDPAP